MSDFLDLVLTRGYGAIASAVRPRPVARFELPDRVPPATETPPALTPTVSAPAAAPMVTPSVALAPSTSPMETRELIMTRDLLTIRETTLRTAPLAAELPAAPMETSQTPRVEVKQIAGAPAAPRNDPAAPIEANVQSTAPVQPVTPQPVAPLIVPLRPQPQTEPPPEIRPTAPVVHVRIGRVELHGPPPAARPAQPPAPRRVSVPVRPVRSLEDYLRRRSEER